ncbi:hypothetical protein HY041_03075 [Candidatus Roizmanbacteria bacterium]|nr:hypothetical protein [Candidatus Roizmanbacteria bacterium]
MDWKIREYYADKSLERLRFFSEEKMLGKYAQLIKNLLNDKKLPIEVTTTINTFPFI